VSIAIGIVGLLLLVLVHEAGHFVVAKLVGARATRFYIGFPPAVLRRRRGDTEYGIGAIPLGGYVRIVGMTRPQPVDLWRVVDAADEAKQRRDADSIDQLTPASERLTATLAAGRLDDTLNLVPAAQDALAADAALLHPKTHRQAARDLERLREELDPRAYWRLAVWRRIAIIAAGPGANILAAVVILAAYFMIGEPIYDRGTHVAGISANRPAAAAGLHAGDQVLAVNGVATPHGPQITTLIQAAHGAPITLTVKRATKTLTLRPVRAQYDASLQRWLLGFTSDEVRIGTQRDGPVTATRRAVTEAWVVADGTFSAIGSIVTPKGRSNLTTPVGIVSASSSAVNGGYYPRILAYISLALAIFNLLPFLPLDGGHILFAVIEKVRGRPIARSVFERVSVVGIALMLVLFWVGLQNDIGRLGGP
jgi:regulator of sigma E protease